MLSRQRSLNPSYEKRHAAREKIADPIAPHREPSRDTRHQAWLKPKHARDDEIVAAPSTGMEDVNTGGGSGGMARKVPVSIVAATRPGMHMRQRAAQPLQLRVLHLL